MAATSVSLIRSALTGEPTFQLESLSAGAHRELQDIEIQLSQSLLDAHSIEIERREARRAGHHAKLTQLALKSKSNSAATQVLILQYLAAFIKTRPAGMIRSFRIHLTDSRPLDGRAAVAEWKSSPYLQALRNLTVQAAAHFDVSDCVTQTFIIPSFQRLTSDVALANALFEEAQSLVAAKIGCRLVNIRFIEQNFLPARNFCVFEGGLGLTLDLGRLQVTRISLDTESIRFLAAHEKVDRNTTPDTYAIGQSVSKSLFDNNLSERAADEYKRGSAPVRGEIGPQQYDHTTAQMWSDDRWVELRRQAEGDYLARWLEREKLDRGGAALVAACGTGLHALWLSEKGFTVDAFDASPFQIGEARRLQEEAKQRPQGLANDGDYRTLTYGDFRSVFQGPYDFVLALGGSLIHLTTNELEKAFENLSASLRPGGLALIEHRDMNVLNCNPTLSNRTMGRLKRRLQIDAEAIIFSFVDEAGDTVTIKGIPHQHSAILAIAERHGFALVRDDHDRKIDATNDCPEWHSFTLKKIV